MLPTPKAVNDFQIWMDLCALAFTLIGILLYYIFPNPNLFGPNAHNHWKYDRCALKIITGGIVVATILLSINLILGLFL